MAMTDDYSRRSGVYLLKSKSEAPLRIQEAITQMERLFPDTLMQQIRSDGGGESIGANLGEWLKARNIRHQKSCPYSPQQNGVAERRNGVLLGCMRTLLANSGLPLSGGEMLSSQPTSYTMSYPPVPLQGWSHLMRPGGGPS